MSQSFCELIGSKKSLEMQRKETLKNHSGSSGLVIIENEMIEVL